MNRTKLILFLFCIHLSALIGAQIDWNNPLLEITESDGLPSTYLKDFEEDDYGFIWILTYSGLCRLDGSHLEVIRDTLLPKEGYSDMVYDSANEIMWIASHRELYSYHLPEGTVKRHRYWETFGNSNINVLTLGHDGNLWLGTRDGTVKMEMMSDTSIFKPLKVDHPQLTDNQMGEVQHILQDPVRKDRIWLYSSKGLITYDPEKSVLHFANDLVGNQYDLKITEIFAHPKSRYLYFGTRPSGKKEMYNYLVFDPLQDQIVQKIYLDENWDNRKICAFSDSLVLFSTSLGVSCYNEHTGEVFEHFINEPNSSASYRVNYVDSKGNLWSGNKEGIKMYGTSYASGEQYYYQSDFPGWYHIITDINYDHSKNKVLLPVFGGEGLYEFDPEQKNWQVYPYFDEERKHLKTDFISAMRLSDGQLRIMGNSGFYQLNALNEVEKTDFPVPGKYHWKRAFLDSHDILWATNKSGVVKIDLNNNTIDSLGKNPHDCKANTRIIFFEDSQSNVWIGGYCDGFKRFDRLAQTFQSFDIGQQLNGGFITTFDEQNGRLWAQANYGDIMVVDVDQPEKGIVEHIAIRDLVNSNEIELVNDEALDFSPFPSGKFDDSGRFWFLSDKGIYCYDPKRARIELFDESTGIAVNDPELNVFVAAFMIKLPNGLLLFNNRKGICMFDPERISYNVDPPVPYIQSVLINNEEIKADSSSIFKKNYHFGPEQNFIGFNLSAIDFAKPSETKFLYKMEGVDEDWKDPRDKRYLSYTQLRGGNYTFWLKASNASDNWSDEIVRLNLVIDKFWYNKEWAIGLFIASILFLVFALYFNRVKRAIEKEQLKTAYEKDLAELKMQALTAQMNPHFIFNSLNSIDFYIIKNETKKASHYLNRFSTLMRLILNNSQSNYVTLKNDIDALKLYLEIESLRFNHSFGFEILVDQNIDTDYLKIPPMLIQPYVENSIWHGLLHKKEDGKIIVRFEYDEENPQLKCSIHDNGIGRKKSMEMKNQNKSKKERKSFGMNITKDKLEVMRILHGIDASVEIFDLYDDNNESSGTKVELFIPIS